MARKETSGQYLACPPIDAMGGNTTQRSNLAQTSRPSLSNSGPTGANLRFDPTTRRRPRAATWFAPQSEHLTEDNDTTPPPPRSLSQLEGSPAEINSRDTDSDSENDVLLDTVDSDTLASAMREVRNMHTSSHPVADEPFEVASDSEKWEDTEEEPLFNSTVQKVDISPMLRRVRTTSGISNSSGRYTHSASDSSEEDENPTHSPHCLQPPIEGRRYSLAAPQAEPLYAAHDSLRVSPRVPMIDGYLSATTSDDNLTTSVSISNRDDESEVCEGEIAGIGIGIPGIHPLNISQDMSESFWESQSTQILLKELNRGHVPETGGDHHLHFGEMDGGMMQFPPSMQPLNSLKSLIAAHSEGGGQRTHPTGLSRKKSPQIMTQGLFEQHQRGEGDRSDGGNAAAIAATMTEKGADGQVIMENGKMHPPGLAKRRASSVYTKPLLTDDGNSFNPAYVDSPSALSTGAMSGMRGDMAAIFGAELARSKAEDQSQAREPESGSGPGAGSMHPGLTRAGSSGSIDLPCDSSGTAGSGKTLLSRTATFSPPSLLQATAHAEDDPAIVERAEAATEGAIDDHTDAEVAQWAAFNADPEELAQLRQLEAANGGRLGTPPLAKKMRAKQEAQAFLADLSAQMNPDIPSQDGQGKNEAGVTRTLKRRRYIDAYLWLEGKEAHSRVEGATFPGTAIDSIDPGQSFGAEKAAMMQQPVTKGSCEEGEDLTAADCYVLCRVLIGECIGSGSSCEVYAGVAGEHIPVAVKQFGMQKTPEDFYKVVHLEVDILKAMQHPNIVRYFGMRYSRRRREGYLILELVSGGNLTTMLQKHSPDGMSFERLIPLLRGIVRGLGYLHAHNIIHRDIKPQNILIADDLVPRITDFGLSTKIIDSQLMRKTFVGTPWYCAPEVIRSQPYTNKCDIWSLGCVIFELVTGKCPFYGMDAVAAMFRIGCGNMVAPPQQCHAALTELMTQCWTMDFTQRPSCVDILDIPCLVEATDPSFYM
jgi:hypothetical protein